MNPQSTTHMHDKIGDDLGTGTSGSVGGTRESMANAMACGRPAVLKLAMAALLAVLSVMTVAGLAPPASAATSSITVYAPSATCTMNFNLQGEVDLQAMLLHQVGTTAYYSADLRLWYSGQWHTVTSTGTRATTTNRAEAWFTPTNGYTWDGYTAYVRLWVYNNYGSGWKWYAYSTNSCVVP
jgi:hypothetical protein